MLRASRQLVRPGGRTAFFTIHPTPGLSPQQLRRAHRAGPVAVATSWPHRELLRRAGFTEIAEMDCTSEFRHVARAWIDQWEQHRDELEDLVGVDAFAERQHERRTQLAAVEDGLLRRSLFVAVRPPA